MTFGYGELDGVNPPMSDYKSEVMILTKLAKKR